MGGKARGESQFGESAEWTQFTVEDLPSERARLLYREWLARHPEEGGGMPARSDFDPLSLPPRLLPHLVLIDIVPDAAAEARYHVRLAGTAILEESGMELTGRYMDELLGFERPIARAHRIRRLGAPLFAPREPLAWSAKDFRFYSVLGLPLARDHETIDQILYLLEFEGS